MRHDSRSSRRRPADGFYLSLDSGSLEDAKTNPTQVLAGMSMKCLACRLITSIGVTWYAAHDGSNFSLKIGP
jgi:hypothetical protein